jgi:hypothetical protein
MVFTFVGRNYSLTLNGQLIETGEFSLSGTVLNYRVLTGPAAGRSGQNQVIMQAPNLMRMTQAGGMTLLYVRVGAALQAYPSAGTQYPQPGPYPQPGYPFSKGNDKAHGK